MKVGQQFKVRRGFKLVQHGKKTHVNAGAVGVITALTEGHVEIEVGKRAKHAGRMSTAHFQLVVSDDWSWGSASCKFCGETFKRMSRHQVYCSDHCRRLTSKAKSAERNFSPALITNYFPVEWQEVQRLAASKPWI